MENSIQSYAGDEKYVFVSYSHRDSEQVFSDLACLRDKDINVAYDDGISPGSRWTDDIARAIENCSVLVAFVSPSFVGSENCINEIDFAVSKRRKVLTVYLEPTDLPPGTELSLSGRQAIFRHQLDADIYRERLVGAVENLSLETPGVQQRQGSPTSSPAGNSRFLIAIASLCVLSVLVYFVAKEESPDGSASVDVPRRTAVAVLRFQNKTGNDDQEFLADGFADDLAVRLGQWANLPVVSPASSFRLSPSQDARDVGENLDARYIVHGVLYEVGDRLKIRTTLTDSVSDTIMWSREYDRPIDDAFQLREEVGETILGEINPALLELESIRAVREDPSNFDSWTAAMRGWWYVNTETQEGLLESRAWFEKAIELDPTWGWPHAALALTHFREVVNRWSGNPGESVGQLIKEADAAVQLDSNDAFAHHALGHAYAMKGQIDESLNALARGVELGPNDAMANSCYGMQLAASNRGEDAIKYANQAMSISPDDPWQHRFALVLARAHFSLSDYESAESWALRSLQLRPGFGAFMHSVASPALAGYLERAKQRVQDARGQGPLPPLTAIRAGLSQQTAPDYLERLMRGLEDAGFADQ